MLDRKLWNVIFLLNKIPLTKIVLLKRAKDKKFAPNFYTGIGGKVEVGESVLESANRELKEETGIEGLELKQFAKCFLKDEEGSYFWAILDTTSLPSSADGDLEWTPIETLLNKDMIPSTKAICREWKNRNFETDRSFTIFLNDLGLIRGVKKVSIKKIVDGLVGV